MTKKKITLRLKDNYLRYGILKKRKKITLPFFLKTQKIIHLRRYGVKTKKKYVTLKKNAKIYPFMAWPRKKK